MSQGLRRQARGYALQVLYAVEVGESGDFERAVEETWANFEIELPQDAIAFAKQLATAVARHKDDIDRRLQEASRNWRVERMSRVDRNILRLAVAELLDPESNAPRRVVINEAVELGKRYGAEDSPGFINGILDRVATDLGKE